MCMARERPAAQARFISMRFNRRRRFPKALAPVLLAALGVWLLVGCLYIPTFNRRVSGRDVSPEVGDERSKRPVRVNHATRADVVKVLGQPMLTSYDGRRVAYHWTTMHALWVWPLCFQAYPENETRTLVLTFDEGDTLSAYQVTTHTENLLTSGGPVRPRLPREFFPPASQPHTAPASRPMDVP